MKSLRKIWMSYRYPIGFGVFFGLMGSILIGMNLGGVDGVSNPTFFVILCICLGIGAVFTPLVTAFWRRRRRRILAAQARSSMVATSSTASTSTSSGTWTGTTSVTLDGGTGPQRGFNVVCRPQPYKPPMILGPPIVEEDPYDTEALVTIIEDIYTKKTPAEIVPRILKDIVARAPTKSQRRFKLSAIRSEGPVTAEGTCAAGWTFFFVREDERLGCLAVVTRRELSLLFGPTTDVEIPFSLVDVDGSVDLSREEVPDIAAAMRLVHEEVPDASELPLYVRVSLPDSVLVYTREPVAVADVQVVGERFSFRNAEGFLSQIQACGDAFYSAARWSVEELEGWYSTKETSNDALRSYFEQPGALLGFDSGELRVYRRLGRGLFAQHGAMTVKLLEERALAALKQDEVDLSKFLIRCIAFVPNATAIARLHTLSNTVDERVRPLAADFFQKRRERRLGVRFDPLEELNFRELREAMGRPGVVTIALHSKSYDIRESLLARLADLRLQTKRLRVVTSRRSPRAREEAEFNIVARKGLITGASLRAADGGDCEALLVVIPSPVPAYVLHLAGSAAEVFAQRIRKQNMEYTMEMLDNELRQRERQQLPALHRAVTYLTIWDPQNPPGDDVTSVLIDAYHSYPRSWQLKRSIIEALEYVPAPDLAGDVSLDDATANESPLESPDLVNAFLTKEIDYLRHPVTEMEKSMLELLTETYARRRGGGSSIIQPVISMTGAHEPLPAQDEESDRMTESVGTAVVDSTAVSAQETSERS